MDVRFSRARLTLMPGLSLVFLVLLIPAARAVEFTSDATITSSLYTGHDTIVNHCTLTIDWGGAAVTAQAYISFIPVT